MNQNQHNPSHGGSRASLIVLIVLAFLLMIAAVVLVINIPDEDSWITSDVPEQSEATAEIGFVLDPVLAQQVYPFADGVFKVSSSRVAFLDFEGVEIFSADIDMNMPFVKSTDDYFLAADRDGFGYILFDRLGERFRGTLAGRVLGAAISPAGDLALISDQNNSTGIVSYIDARTGQKLYDCHFPESGHVLSVSFSPFADYFDVVLLNTMSAAAQMVIKRFNTDGTAVGQYLPRQNRISSLLVYNTPDHMILCGSAGIAALSYRQDEPVWDKSYYHVQTALSGDDHMLLIAAKNIDGPYALYALNADGSETELFSLGEKATGLQAKDNLAAVYWSSRLAVVDIRTGEEIYADELGSELVRVGFADARTLLAVTRAGLMRIVIP